MQKGKSAKALRFKVAKSRAIVVQSLQGRKRNDVGLALVLSSLSGDRLVRNKGTGFLTGL